MLHFYCTLFKIPFILLTIVFQPQFPQCILQKPQISCHETGLDGKSSKTNESHHELQLSPDSSLNIQFNVMTYGAHVILQDKSLIIAHGNWYFTGPNKTINDLVKA